MENEQDYVALPNTLEKDFRRFFKTLHINLNRKTRHMEELSKLESTSHISMSNSEKSIIILGDEVRDYRNMTDKLVKIYPYSKNFGRDYAERTLRDAIWAVLSKRDSNEGWKEGYKYIKEKYRMKNSLWDVYLPVSGMSFLKKAKWSFGSAIFLKRDDPELKRGFINSVFSTLNQDNSVNHFMKLTVSAVDYESAIKIGKSSADLHISILNALADISGISKYDKIFSYYME